MINPFDYIIVPPENLVFFRPDNKFKFYRVKHYKNGDKVLRICIYYTKLVSEVGDVYRSHMLRQNHILHLN